MLHNNNNVLLLTRKHSWPPYMPSNFFSTLLLLLIIGLAQSGHTGKLQQLGKVTLMRQQQSYYLPININHHSLKLKAQLQAGRSWMKQALCKVCDLGSQQCSGSCFVEKDEPKISCDSSFCSSLAEYNDQTRGISGKEVQIFLKINNKQVLMPIIFADKLYKQQAPPGEFHIFDEESSFTHGFLTRSPSGSLELINGKGTQEDTSLLQQKQGERVRVSLNGEQFDFSQIRVNKVVIHHVDNPQFNDFTDSQEMQVEFSLQQSFLTFPLRLAKRIEKYLNETYLGGKHCKLLPNKLKCSGDIEMHELFRTLIHFQIEKQLLAVPLHLLVTGCSSKECTTLIHFKESPHADLILGTVIWQLYNLQYNTDKQSVIFHRKNTQFDDLFQLDTLKASESSFLYVLALLLYHILVYVFKILFWLAVLSLAVNCIIKWRQVAKWCQRVIFRQKGEKVAQTQEHFEQSASRRRIRKVVDPFQDSENL